MPSRTNIKPSNLRSKSIDAGRESRGSRTAAAGKNPHRCDEAPAESERCSGEVTRIVDALEQAAANLKCSSDSPRLDAQLLLAYVLEINRAALITRGETFMPLAALKKFEEFVERRGSGEPIAYITGQKEFWSMPLQINRAVLVPRPETEVLVECALQLLPHAAARVLDLGTGSGAIALAIAREWPRACVIGTDISVDALEVARANAAALGISNVEWRSGAWFDAVPNERFDLIVSNPPYVALGDPHLPSLAAEPQVALVAGASGLEAFHDILGSAMKHLNAGGHVALEHGASQAPALMNLLEQYGFCGVRSRADFSNTPRVVLGHSKVHHD